MARKREVAQIAGYYSLNKPPMIGHDIVAIGASAGGFEALRRVVGGLPADLPAAVFVVSHLGGGSPGMLPSILDRAGSLEAAHPEDGESVENGQIYVAPPNLHLLLEDGTIRLTRGPHENRHRPAVDPLFRTAALSYGPRVIAVVLSGALDDGPAGHQAAWWRRCRARPRGGTHSRDATERAAPCGGGPPPAGR